MDNSLKEMSIAFDNAIQQAIIDSRAEYDTTHKRIMELSNILQEMEKTDLRENADYQMATDERDTKNALANLLLRRIESMSKEVGTYIPTGFITLGTTLDLNVIAVNGKPPKLPKTRFYGKIVQHDTSDATKGLFAIDSKAIAGMIGRRAGDIVDAETLMGIITYKIERIY